MNFLSSFILLQILLSLLLFLFFAPLAHSQKLRLLYASLILSLGFACVQPFVPGPSFLNTTVKIWAADSMNDLPSGYESSPIPSVLSFNDRTVSLDSGPLSQGGTLLIVIALLIVFFLTGREALLLRKLFSRALLIRKQGRISILVSPDISVPFSFWRPGSYLTVLPSHMLEKPEYMQPALLHEFQHHRQGDTRLTYLLLVLRGLCFFNPCVHLLAKKIAELQELACDETVLATRKTSVDDYTGCLLSVAATSVQNEFEPVCAAGLCFRNGRNILMRRIQMIQTPKSPKPSWHLRLLFALTFVLLAGATYASRGWIQDRRITEEEALNLAERAQQGTSFPIVINEFVLAELNRFIGTREGREHMRKSLARKKNYERILTWTHDEYKTPLELNAIPIVESGYVNLPPVNSIRSAGLWMFIPATARTYGMEVSAQRDQRLDPITETRAAHRYLRDNHRLFNDWLLAIFAYNVGETAVAKGIRKHGTRDVWKLMKHIKGDKDYMARVMASIIIMKNPEVLE